MYSIMDAVEAAQKRAEERDATNAVRRARLLVPTTQEIMPVENYGRQDGGNGPGIEDTRTQHQKYLDAIDANQYVGAIPVVGPVLGAMNDSFIQEYEKQNPNMVTGGGINKYSMIGRIGGKGLTVEEQLEAEKAGLGLGKTLGFGEQAGQPGYTLFDRVFGSTPMNIASEGDYIGSFPEGSSDDGGGGDIGGYREEDLSYDSFAGPIGYA
jgi:hypothetical protein